MEALVVELAEYVKAQRARDALDNLLGGWGWYLRGDVEVKPSGRIVVFAVTMVACSSTVRRDIFLCIPSAVNGVPVETRPQNAPNVETSAAVREADSVAYRVDGETE